MKTHFLALSLTVVPWIGGSVDFKSEILPIFESKCFRCHGKGESKGGLKLDADEISRHIRASGAIRPGNSGRSDLVERLETDDADEKMPKNGTMDKAQIELVKKWIDEGAKLDGSAPDPITKAPAAPQPVKGSWTNKEGKTIEATLLKVEGPNAILKLGDGRAVPYPIDNLSPESQAKVKEFQDASKPAP